MSTVTFTLPERKVDLNEPVALVCSEGCGEILASDMDKHAAFHRSTMIRVQWRRA